MPQCRVAIREVGRLSDLFTGLLDQRTDRSAHGGLKTIAAARAEIDKLDNPPGSPGRAVIPYPWIAFSAVATGRYIRPGRPAARLTKP